MPDVEGLRIETAIQSSFEISIHYDPIIAKIIIWGKTRSAAQRKMIYTLRNLKCLGLTTNQDFLLHLFEQEAVQIGDYDTHYIKNHFDAASFADRSDDDTVLAAVAATLMGWSERESQRTLLKIWNSSLAILQVLTH